MPIWQLLCHGSGVVIKWYTFFKIQIQTKWKGLIIYPQKHCPRISFAIPAVLFFLCLYEEYVSRWLIFLWLKMVSSSFPHIILHSVSSRGNGNQHLIIGDLFVNKGCQKGELEKNWASSTGWGKMCGTQAVHLSDYKVFVGKWKARWTKSSLLWNGIANIATGDWSSREHW